MMAAGDPSQDRLESADHGPLDQASPLSKGVEHRPAGQAGADIGTLSAQATALIGACALRDLRTYLEELETRIAALDPAALTPRRGLAGLFDSRSRRLKTFRSAYRATAGRTTELADALSRGAGALAARHEALSGLWADLREAATAAAPVKAPAPLAPERPEPLGDHPRSDGPITGRKVALARLAALRAARNAEHHIPTRLLEVRDGVLAWQADWEDALGLTTRKARRLRPDGVQLDAARSTLLDRLARANEGLDQGLQRKVELTRRSG